MLTLTLLGKYFAIESNTAKLLFSQQQYLKENTFLLLPYYIALSICS